MGLGINTNVPSINAQRNLEKSQMGLATSLQRLSTGLRINSAKDDAAGLAISNRLTSQIKGLGQASRNANDGISLAQTAEGALSESTNILQRIRELAVQSANATNSSSDRLSLQSEVNQLVSELDRISETTSFNSIKLLDGSFQAQQFQVGADSGQTIQVNIAKSTSDSLGIEKFNTDNATLGVEVATGDLSVNASGTSNGKASTGNTTVEALTDAAFVDQKITVTDKDGQTSIVSINDATDSRDASVIATKLDAINGVNATANANSVSFDTSAPSTNGDKISFSLVAKDGGTPENISLVVDSATYTSDFDAKIQTAIGNINTANGDSDLSYDTATQTITSASGVNLGVESLAVEDNAQVTFSNFANVSGETISFAIDGETRTFTAGDTDADNATALLQTLTGHTNFGTNFTAALDSTGEKVVVTGLTPAGGTSTDLGITAYTGNDANTASQVDITSTAGSTFGGTVLSGTSTQTLTEGATGVLSSANTVTTNNTFSATIEEFNSVAGETISFKLSAAHTSDPTKAYDISYTATGTQQGDANALKSALDLALANNTGTNDFSVALSGTTDVVITATSANTAAAGAVTGISLSEFAGSNVRASGFTLTAGTNTTVASASITEAATANVAVTNITATQNNDSLGFAGQNLTEEGQTAALQIGTYNITVDPGTNIKTDADNGTLDRVSALSTGTDVSSLIGAEIADQTVTVTDASGATTAVNIDAASGSRDAASIASALSAVEGVTATADANEIDFAATTVPAALQHGDKYSFDLYAGDSASPTNVSFTLTASGATADPTNGDFTTQFNAAVQTALSSINNTNGNSDLSYDDATQKLTSASGANLAVENFDTLDNAAIEINTFTQDAATDTTSFTLAAAAGTISYLSSATADDNLLAALQADANFNKTFTASLNDAGDSVEIIGIDGASLDIELVTGTSTDTADGFTISTTLDNISASGTTVTNIGAVSDGSTASAISATNVQTDTLSVEGKSLVESGGTTGSDSLLKVSSFSVTVADGFSIATDNSTEGALDLSSDGIFDGAANTNVTFTNGVGGADTSTGNNVAAQALTLTGTGTGTIDIQKDQSAKNIVDIVNSISETTGVTASAKTTATLSGLSTNGVTSFNLNGTDVSANITTTDYTSLVTAINDQSGKTGVIATLNNTKTEITLTQSTGEDIKIENFSSSAANATTNAVVSLDVAGSEGIKVKVSTGELGVDRDSTVVGGNIEFKSTAGTFNITSSLDADEGGLFASDSSILNSSDLESVASLDISTVAGANAAIDIVDGAIASVDSNRASLGAIQNRFTSTISNLAVSVENLSAARSRILDTDFASETAELTRNQILQQAGTAILAQANQLPQSVLSLLG